MATRPFSRLLTPALRCSRRALASAADEGTAFDLSRPGDIIDARFTPRELDELGVTATDFKIWRSVFSAAEQDELLAASLSRLDAAAMSAAARAARKAYRKRVKAGDVTERIGSGFRDESAYAFESNHLDGVIDSYREMTLREWPSGETYAELDPVLQRLYAFVDGPLTPDDRSEPHRVPSRIIAHLLHLSSTGRIDPHVDNVDASVRAASLSPLPSEGLQAGQIVGLSLGSPRVMRLRHVKKPTVSFDVLMEPGSVYSQRGSVRYQFDHSVLGAGASFRGRAIDPQQRVSVMLRVRLRPAC